MSEKPLLESNRELSGLPPNWYTPPSMVEVMSEDQLCEFVGVLNERVAKLYKMVTEKVNGEPS